MGVQRSRCRAGESVPHDAAARQFSGRFLVHDDDDFKHLKRWIDELAARPAVKRGMEVGSDFGGEYEKLPKEEIERLTKLLYNQRARKAPDEV